MSERAVIVARVSSLAQTEASQLPIAQAWCDQHGYEVVYTEPIKGKSAKTGAHLAQLEIALRMIERGLADVIVMVRLDRMSRQGLEAAVMLRKRVKDAGGRWEFARQTRLNGYGIEADREWARRSMDAQEESELRMERIAEGYAEAMANGAAIHKARYGWKLTGDTQAKRWIADKARTPIVLGIFETIADGGTLRCAVGYAKEADPSVEWSPQHIRRMCADTAYSAGIVETTYNGEPYSFTVPAFVPQGLWNRANAAMRKPKRFKAQPKSRFSGVLHCTNGHVLMRKGQTRGMHWWECKERCFRIRDDRATARAHLLLRLNTDALYDETLVVPADDREIRRSALEREQRGLSAKYSDIDRMIARATEIKAELAAIDAEIKPRGHVERTPTGQTLGQLYQSMTDDMEINRVLKAHNVKVVLMSTEALVASVTHGIEDPDEE